ncbi:ROK family transcriptional regulator [Streptomyces sp. NBC_00083]|uniref:ROK family transcriptional regulator n=1 Tax=Streptomyces sp. NBC_00083 TaxID=2975647 RepID=UPI00224FD7CF|nr:ROK family transcriptional regulator [Streptomyces sp. NBC_00083]MCX5386829.1 ROK family protein [Streptomyces sp. NBC_00083]
MPELRAASPPHTEPSWAAESRDRGAIRRTNLGVVLRLLRDAGPRSRARIAADAGLPKPTVTSLVAELVALGLVREGPARREGAVGRPGAEVRLHGHAVCGIGVEVSTSYVQVVALALDGVELYGRRVTVDVAAAGPDAVLDLAACELAACRTAVQDSGVHPAGITVAAPGVVDTASGTARYAPAIGWRDVAVTEGLRTRLTDPPPLALDNDAKLAALAEYAAVRVEDVHDMVCVTGERGIGAGVISAGRLLRGANGFAGEVGHMPLDPERRPCACGRRGCWETMVGLDAILRLAADEGDVLHDPTVELGDRLDLLRTRARAADPRTVAAMARVADDLGLGVALLADVLNPGVVVLGGYFTHIGDLMIERVRAVVHERVMAPDAGGCEVRLSTLGFAAAARGGAYLALNAVFEDPAGA